MANRLAQETSPYLLQHKDNPVDWYPWGDEVLTKARQEDKPILLSIGYSACHWCHVMEHESFEDPATAELMNREFVSIKVDREERPDLDNLYMTAVQAMTGHGGWPLNVFLTPEGVPFYGGTYWPPEDRMGMPSFTKVLEGVAEAYRERREGVEENSARLREYLEKAMASTPSPSDIEPQLLDQAAKALARSFDGEHGGFGGAPKFPQPAVLEFLLREQKRTSDGRAASMVTLTLDKMAGGGMYDQIGGGFHRYAVDAIWLVPHFEKMLYDNAQLARIYLDAYRAFGSALYRRIATETLEYVTREMTSPEGGFYSTQDADTEGEEGKSYVWTPEEIDAVLGPEDGRLLREYYGVTHRGNFEGKSILNVAREPRYVAAELEVPEEGMLDAIARGRKKLYEARSKRVQPGRDEKILTAWNGLMLRAFAEGSRVLSRADFREVAERNATFLLDKLRRPDGKLYRSYKDGQARLNAYLEDYAALGDGLLALYEATFERRWIDEAVGLVETMLVEFADPDGPMLYDTGLSHEALISRPRDLQDGATPSGNSIAAGVLLRLAAMTGRESYGQRASDMLRALARPMAEHPTAFGRWLCDLDIYLATIKEVAVAGERSDPALHGLADVVYSRYEPNAILGYSDPNDATLAELLPFLAFRPARDGKATAYVCEHFACLPPVTTTADLAVQLEQGTGVIWRDF
jgi:uncharacterized protein YyaL (SSP411 family)